MCNIVVEIKEIFVIFTDIKTGDGRLKKIQKQTMQKVDDKKVEFKQY
jgi:predicted Holliday junction resolvase-like endonuclease